MLMRETTLLPVSSPGPLRGAAVAEDMGWSTLTLRQALSTHVDGSSAMQLALHNMNLLSK